MSVSPTAEPNPPVSHKPLVLPTLGIFKNLAPAVGKGFQAKVQKQ